MTTPRTAPASVPARRVGSFDFDRTAIFPNADRITGSGLPANTQLRFHSYMGEGDSVALNAKTGNITRGVIRENGGITAYTYIDGPDGDRHYRQNSGQVAVPAAVANELDAAWRRAYRDGRITQAEALQLNRVREVLHSSLTDDRRFDASEIRDSLAAIRRVAPAQRAH